MSKLMVPRHYRPFRKSEPITKSRPFITKMLVRLKDCPLGLGETNQTGSLWGKIVSRGESILKAHLGNSGPSDF